MHPCVRVTARHHGAHPAPTHPEDTAGHKEGQNSACCGPCELAKRYSARSHCSTLLSLFALPASALPFSPFSSSSLSTSSLPSFISNSLLLPPLLILPYTVFASPSLIVHWSTYVSTFLLLCLTPPFSALPCVSLMYCGWQVWPFCI